MIQPDRKYLGKVEPGSTIFESKTKGTLGFRVMLSCEDGPCHYDMWLTPGTYERAVKTFAEVLGVRKESLQDNDFVSHKLAHDITGRDVEFDTEGESYTDDYGNEKITVKVKWLNRPGGSVKPASPERLANFFLGQVAKPAQDFPRTPPQTPISDDDIPF